MFGCQWPPLTKDTNRELNFIFAAYENQSTGVTDKNKAQLSALILISFGKLH